MYVYPYTIYMYRRIRGKETKKKINLNHIGPCDECASIDNRREGLKCIIQPYPARCNKKIRLSLKRSSSCVPLVNIKRN